MVLPLLLGKVFGLLAIPYSAHKYVWSTGSNTPEAAAWIDLPETYQKSTASQKAELLWKKVEQSKYSIEDMPTWETGSGGKSQLLATGVLSVAPSFTCNPSNSDILPVDRARGIHSLGVVGRMKWTMSTESKRNNFTGLLANGATTHGIIRFSEARPMKADNDYVPGFGIKLLVDGWPSVNTVANMDLDGSANKNFFSGAFSTAIPVPTAFAKKALAARFDMEESPSNWLPVRDLARLTPDGKLIENPVYPHALQFRPHERVASLIANDSTIETRTILQQKLSAGPLVHVYAASSMDDPDAFKIGEIALETGVLASSFGDNRLCFKHQRHVPRANEEF